MTRDELERFLEYIRETEDVELKAPGRLEGRTDPLVGQVIRAMLAMANHRGGGDIIIGIEERAGRFEATGLDRGDAETWRLDRLSDRVARHADPSIDFDIRQHEIAGRLYVNIAVSEFRDVPVLAREEFRDSAQRLLIRRGATYLRPRRKPESIEPQTSADLRDLLDLAVAKAVARELDRLRDYGFLLRPSSAPDAEQFRRQRGDL
ncbi:MAG: putative DNA binding domain-containing protein [Dehalococcoidia bacterium]